MIINEFVPFSMSALTDYLYKNFNVNIKDIPTEDFKSLIYYKYCKNIINDEICVRSCKKIDTLNRNEDFICSKCCEKKKIKKDKVYKKKKKKEKMKTDEMNIHDDSGYYTDIDNLGDNKIQYQNLKSEKELLFNSCDTNKNNEKRNFIKFGNLDVELNNEYEHLINNLPKNKYENKILNHYINNKYITFGSFNIKIKNKIYFYNSLFDNINIGKKENNKNLNSINFIFDKNDNKDCIKNTFTFSKDSDSGIIKKDYLFNNNYNCNIFKENKYLYSDLYYIFTYLIYIIFNFSDIKIIKNELYNCLGDIGIDYYISQYISLSNNVFDY